MHNAGGMRFGQGISNLNRILKGVGKRQIFAALQLIERLALDEFHGNEIIAVVGGNVINRDDVRMVQRRSRPGFLHKALPAFRVAHLVGRQQLQRDRPVQVRVERLVDDAHATFAELLLNLVVGQGLARHFGLRTLVDLDIGGT